MSRVHSRRFGARALACASVGALTLALVVAGAVPTATAAVPAGYAAVTGWSVAGTTGSARLPGNGAGLGTVTTTAPLQLMAMPSPAAPVDGVAVARIDLTAAQIAAGRTACLNGATPGSTRECNGETNKRTTITFPEPVVDPVIAVVAKGAVYTSGGGTPTYCSTAWMNFTVLSVNGSPVAPGQVTAPTVSAAQRFVGGALIYDPTLMTPTARQCVDPTQGGGVSYLKVSGVVTSIYLDSEYRAAVTRNTTGTTTRIATAPPGWQFQPSVPQADLSVTASAPAAVAASGQIEWTYTVRNAGPGVSHGFEVTSEIPAGVTGVTVVSGPADCTVNAGILRCSETPPDCIVVTQNVGDTWASLLCFDEVSPVPTVLAAGGTAAPIVVRATVSAGAASPLINKVTVSGADVDLTTANNSAQASTVVASPSLSVAARVTPTGPAVLRAGDPLAYAVDVTNSGNIAVTAAAITRTAFTGTGAPPTVTCPAGTIGIGATITCTGTYALTQADVDAGTVALSVTATASSAVGAVPASPVATATTTITLSASLSLVTRADTSQVTSLGQTLSYFFDITNTGTATVTRPTVTLMDFTGTGTPPAVTCPSGALAPESTVTCSASYSVLPADAILTAISITSTAGADLLAGGAAPASAPSSLAIPVAVPAAALTLTQVMTPPDGSTVARGGQVTFTLTAVNSGGRPLDAVVTADLSGILTAATVGGDATATIDGVEAGALNRAGSTLTWTGVLAVGRSVVLTYTANLLPDAPSGTYSAVARASGTPAGEPALTTPDASSSFIVATAQPEISIAAEVTPPGPSALSAGDPVVFTVDVTNTGDIAVLAPTVSITSFSGTGTAPEFTCSAGVLGIENTRACTADYILTQADIDSGGVTLSVRAAATAIADDVVAQDTASASLTIERLPSLALTKSADLTEIVAVGQEVVYAFDVTNTGNVTLDAVAVAETAFTGTGSLPPAICPSDALSPGDSTRCTTTYLVTAADAQITSIVNTATATAVAPAGLSAPVSASSSVSLDVHVPAAALTLTQRMSPADGSTVVRGGAVWFTVTVANTGGRPLDIHLTADLAELVPGAVYNHDAAITSGAIPSARLVSIAASPVLDGSLLTWTGPLASGAQAVLTYSATVLQAAPAGTYSTSARATGTAFNEPALVSDEARTAFIVAAAAPEGPGGPEHPGSPGGLPGTGIDGTAVAGVAALALALLAGGGLLVISRRRVTTEPRGRD